MKKICVKCFRVTKNNRWVANRNPRVHTNHFRVIICPHCSKTKTKLKQEALMKAGITNQDTLPNEKKSFEEKQAEKRIIS